MPKIPEEVIQRIKQEISMKDFIESLGSRLHPSGRGYLTLCKFHSDRKPSMSIDPQLNCWFCHGACKEGGSIIDYVMKLHSVEFPKAVEIILDKHPEISSNNLPIKKQIPKTKQAPKAKVPEFSSEDYQALKKVNTYYQNTLKHTQKALDYLKQRGINNPETLSYFQIGFSNRSLSNKLPKNKYTNLRNTLSSLGIFRKSGHEHLCGCITIPIIDEMGRITEMYGRKIAKKIREGSPLHLYLPGPHRGIFNPEAFIAKEIILCESIIDALTFWDKGLKYVTASYGTGGFTQEMLETFIEKGIKKVHIAYDNDKAGNKSAKALAKTLLSHNIQCSRINLPSGMDINEYSLKYPGKEALQKLVDDSESMGEVSFPFTAKPEKKQAQNKQKNQGNPQLLSSFTAKPKPQEEAVKKENPPIPKSLDVPARISPEQIEIIIHDRYYCIRGFDKNLSFDNMRINLQVFLEERFHIDSLNLYNCIQRKAFIKMAAVELGINPEVIKHDVGRVLLKLQQLQIEQIRGKTKPKEDKIVLSTQEEKEAITFLKNPKLLETIKQDFLRCGLVGEESNCLTTYLALTSRKLDNPLAIIIQSLSSAGKSSLMNAALEFMPPEDVVKYTAMSGQSLFYMGENNLVHKILAVSEEEGAEKASYSLKVMQSEKELCIASTGKNPKSGKFSTQEYKVKGPLQIIFTTTSEEIDEELLNRCILLVANADRAQTKAIHDQQRAKETIDGLIGEIEKEHIIKLHRNAQRLLKPVKVINPYAKQLTFLDTQPRTRRDHMKYLTLIKTVAFLHQHQREIKQKKYKNEIISYIEVTPKDIEIANKLIAEVMGKNLDELPPQTRKLLDHIYNMLKQRKKKKDEGNLFTQREVRQYTGWSHNQVKVHVAKLAEMEYLLAFRQNRGQSYKYELLYNGEAQNGNQFFAGLIDIKKLKNIPDQ